MADLIKMPVFGILLALIMYMIGVQINKRIKSPLTNPLLMGMILTIIFLKVTKIPYDDFNVGGSYITFLIAPATVALIINLYKNFNLFIKNIVPVMAGVISGVLTSVVSVFVLSKLLGLDQVITISIVPKSLTTAIGVAISAEYGGIQAVTVVCMVVSGIGGAVIAPSVMKILRVKDPVAQGVGIGTASHAAGTSRAIQMGEVQGAMSGLSIALAGFVSVLILPFLIKLLA